jgi:hypothetical protein
VISPSTLSAESPGTNAITKTRKCESTKRATRRAASYRHGSNVNFSRPHRPLGVSITDQKTVDVTAPDNFS